MRAVRNYRGVGVAEALAGAQLTNVVCKYMRKLFTVHQSLLKGNQEYQGRTWDQVTVCRTLLESLTVALELN